MGSLCLTALLPVLALLLALLALALAEEQESDGGSDHPSGLLGHDLLGVSLSLSSRELLHSALHSHTHTHTRARSAPQRRCNKGSVFCECVPAATVGGKRECSVGAECHTDDDGVKRCQTVPATDWL